MSYAKHTDDLRGRKVGYLVVLKRAIKNRDMWACRCVCGKIYVKPGFHIRNDVAKSCGCMTRKIISASNTVHGRSLTSSINHNTYYVWRSMRSRCDNKNHKSYKDYGGRGIKVCKRWELFTNFLSDMGDVPKDMTIGRIDNNKNYCPENCRWETKEQQANNTRKNRIIEFLGKRMTLKQWAVHAGIARDVIWHRIDSGWDVGDALTKPPKSQKNSRHGMYSTRSSGSGSR